MEEAGDPPRSASRRTSPRKRSRPSDVAAGDDLISALPDSIILHVLSFLDIKDVVKTSALSRRWERDSNGSP
ncbi:hypothetical protein MLD38_036899 [Melastoma candidum]|uniref:Uncharacterized protein n=1 Tax=Melastoma candidum TaxID=119954 RepID=A0ACB9LLD2_9MYRT|nr:hypothetical protein MLD38_036899 [Melastoma candidum]